MVALYNSGHLLPYTFVRLPEGLPVIRGFGFDLEGDGQHLKRLMVDISSVGVAHVKFRDESVAGPTGTNDEYRWFVDWAVVSP